MPIASFKLPDGRIADFRVPEGLSDEEIQQALAPEIRKLLAPPPPEPETTFGGQLTEFAKGIPAGFVGTLGTAAEGLAALLPEDYEKSVVGATRSVVDALTPEAAAGYEDSVGRNLGQALGSVGSFLVPGGAAGIGARALGAGAAGIRAATAGTTGVLGGAAGAGEARQRAEAEEATAEEKATATALGVFPGLLELIPAQRILGRFFKPAEAALDEIPEDFKARALKRIREIAKTGGIEAAQEAAQGFAQNLIAQNVYKPDQDLIEGLGEQAAYGGAAGAMTEALLGLALGKRASGVRDELERKAREERAATKRQEEQIAADREIAEGAQAPLLSAEEAVSGDLAGAFSQFDAVEREKEKSALAEEVQAEYQTLYRQAESLQDEAAAAAQRGDGTAAGEAARKLEMVEGALKQLETRTKKKDDDLFGVKLEKPERRIEEADLETGLRERIGKVKKKLEKAGDLGDFKKIQAASAELNDLKAQLSEMKQQGDLFGATNMRGIEKAEAAIAEAEAKAQAEIEKAEAKAKEIEGQTVKGERMLRAIEEEKQATESAQERATRRLEFGLERMPLAPLGFSGDVRVEEEAKLKKGLISPQMAKALGITGVKEDTRAIDSIDALEDAYNRDLRTQQQNSERLLDAENQLFDVEGKLTPYGVTAVTNEARLRTLGRLRSMARESRDVLESQRQLEEAEQTLAEEVSGAGKFRRGAEKLTQASAPERLRKEIENTETQLEKINAQLQDKEGKSVEELQDLELEARKLQARIQRLEKRGSILIPGGGLPAVDTQELKLKDDALDTFGSTIYDLQRGTFLGARPTRPEIAEAETKRNAELREKISNAKAELEKVKTALKQPDVIRNRRRSETLGRRQSAIEGDIKKLEAGLSAQPEKGRATFPMIQKRAKDSITSYVNSAVNEINAARVTSNQGQLSASEEQNVRSQLRDYLEEALGRATAAERVTGEEVAGTRADAEGRVSKIEVRKNVPTQQAAAFEKIKTGLSVLKKNLDATISKAKGEKPEVEVPVETQEPPKKTEIKRGTSKILDLVDRIKELESQRERAKPETLAVNVLQDEVTRLTELAQLVKDMRRIPPAQREEAGFGEEQLRGIKYVTNPEANAKLLQDLRSAREALRVGKKVQKQQADAFDAINTELDSLEKQVADTINESKKAKPESTKDTLQDKVKRSVEILFNIKKETVKLTHALSAIGSQRSNIEKKLKTRNTREGRAELMAQLKAVRQADKEARGRIALLKTMDSDIGNALKRLGLEARADQVVQVSLPNYSGTGSFVVDQPIGLRLTPYQARGERLLSEIENDARVDKVFENASQAEARMSLIPVVRGTIRSFEQLASEQQAMIGRAQASMRKARKEDKPRWKERIERMTKNAERIENQIATAKKSLAVVSRGGRGAVDGDEKPSGSKFTFAEIQLAKKALDERITATQARLKELPPVERSFKDVLEAARIGAIKTPEGKALPETRVTTEYALQARPRDPEVVKVEREEAEKLSAKAEEQARENYERVKNDPAATQKEKNVARLAIARAAKIKKQVKEFEFVNVPVRTKVTRLVDPDTAQTIAATERRFLEERLQKKGVTTLKDVEEAVEAAKEDKLEKFKAYQAYKAAGNKLKETEAKAAYLNAEKVHTAAYMARVRFVQKLKELEGKAAAAPAQDTSKKGKKLLKNASTDLYLDLDETLDDEAKSAIKQQIQDKDDIDWRVGEEVVEVIDPKDFQTRLDDIKQKAAKKGIKFEYYESFEKTPLSVLQQLAKQGMDIYAHRVRGGVKPDGTVFVIVGNHNNMTDVERTLAHELIGHYTTDSLLGKKGLDELMSRVDKTMATKENESGLENLAAKLGLTDEYNDAIAQTFQFYKKRLQDGKITEKELARIAKVKGLREIIAYTTERRVDQSFMEKAGTWLKELVGAVRKALRGLGLEMDFSTSDLFYIIKEADQAFKSGKEVAYVAADGGISLATTKPKWAPTTNDDVIDGVRDIVAAPTPAWERARANFLGLNFRTQFLDRLEALEQIKRRGLETGQLDAVNAVNLLYFARMYDQRVGFTAEAATNGVVQLRKVTRPDGDVEYELSRDMQKDAASLQKVAFALRDAGYGNAQANGEFFTAYMAAERALAVGVEKAGGKTTSARYEALRKEGRANPAIQEARRIYNEYNVDLVTLLEQSGSISKAKAAELKAKKDYVPYYVDAGRGNVDLVVDGEKIMRVGSITEQPQLKELIGSDQKIRDFFDTSLQNTNMIMDMALRNLATRNVGFVLQGLGLAKRVSSAASGDKIIRGRLDGEDAAWEITTDGNDVFGDIPAETIVMGLNGIKLQLPGVMKLFSVPANIFRKFITRDPAYAIRQIFRDSTAAWMAGGSDAKPVVSTFAELSRMMRGKSEEQREILARGLGGGQVITGTPEDMSKIMLQMTSGKPGWEMLMAKLDGFAMSGDVATRVQAYKSFLKQGMTQREAALASLEIMNFSRRGISPSVMYLNAMIPFFSANVQGLDVLYRAFKKQMPFEERIKIFNKLRARGTMVAAMSFIYALAMDDDETYENATPEQRYGNWFVPLPFVDGMFRIPIPFELGFIFKALPEAMARAIASDDTGGEISRDMFNMFMRSVPGDIPLAMKPALEVLTNYSFFTDSPVLSQRMQNLSTDLQVNRTTPDVLRVLSGIGISPAQAEYLIRGYTGSMGIGLLSLLNPAFPDAPIVGDIPEPTTKATEIPIFGRMIQPVDGSGIINKAYGVVSEAEEVRTSYNELVNQGQAQAAEEYFNANLAIFIMAPVAGSFAKMMGELSKLERVIRADEKMSPEEKRRKLDDIRREKIEMSRVLRRTKQDLRVA